MAGWAEAYTRVEKKRPGEELGHKVRAREKGVARPKQAGRNRKGKGLG